VHEVRVEELGVYNRLSLGFGCVVGDLFLDIAIDTTCPILWYSR
jgi:hypothetical protein